MAGSVLHVLGRASQSSPAWLLFLLVFAGSSLLLFLRLGFHTTTDIALHCQITQRSLTTGNWLPNFLYYWSIAAVALLSRDLWALKVSAAVVLSAAVVAKMHLSYRLGRAWLSQDVADSESGLAVLCGLVGVSFSLPLGTSWYLGQVPPNVWHNSTTIAVAPLALALFWSTYCYLVRPGWRLLAWATCLVAVNGLVKPSFLFCLILALPVMLVVRFGTRKETWLGMVPVVAALALIALQYWMLFEGPRDGGELYPTGGGVIAAPLRQWRRFSENIPASLLLSLAFPASVAACRWPDVRRSILFGYAACCLLAGLAIFSVFFEVGPREGHGNFFWQAVLANYVLFFAAGLVCLRGDLVPPEARRYRPQRLPHLLGKLVLSGTPWVVLVAHASFGLLYVIRLANLGVFR